VQPVSHGYTPGQRVQVSMPSKWVKHPSGSIIDTEDIDEIDAPETSGPEEDEVEGSP
jgi:hypothetical protein